MDIFSHGLWGGYLLARKKKQKKQFWPVFVLSMLPDLLSLGVFWILVLTGFSNWPRWQNFHLVYDSLPSYVNTLYHLTHSLLFFSIVYLVVWNWRKKPYRPLLAWGLHILVDIPSHSIFAFPTPFLWPLSNYVYDGISWVDQRFWLPNFILLILVYGGYFYWDKWKQKRQAREFEYLEVE